MRCEKHPANNKEKMLIGSVNILTYILIYLLHMVENICLQASRNKYVHALWEIMSGIRRERGRNFKQCTHEICK